MDENDYVKTVKIEENHQKEDKEKKSVLPNLSNSRKNSIVDPQNENHVVTIEELKGLSKFGDNNVSISPTIFDYEGKIKEIIEMNKASLDDDLIFFPKKDISLEKISKNIKSHSDLRPIDYDKLDPQTTKFFQFLETDWKVLLRNNCGYQKASEGKTYNDLPDEIYESINQKTSIKEEKTHTKDLNQYIRNIDNNIDEIFEKKRKENRMDILRCYNPEYDWGNVESIGSRADESSKLGKNPNKDFIFQPKIQHTFMIEVETLEFALGDFEPFFCSLALYDMKNQKKISEDFHFDTNREGTMSLLAGHRVQKPEHVYSKSKKAIFSIPEASSEVYLVLLVYNILQGDLGKVREPYMTDFQNMSKISKVQTKVKQTAPEFCAQLGSYRQIFAWSPICVFDHQSAFVLQEGKSVIDSLYPLEMKDIFQSLAILKNEKTLSKQKLIRGFYSINVENLSKNHSSFENYLDPMLNINFPTDVTSSTALNDSPQQENIQEYTQTSNEKRTDVNFTKEIQHFSSPQTPSPQFRWKNNLYLYPLKADFSSQKQVKPNFMVKIQLKSNEETVLKCIYGKSSCPIFLDESFTHVTHKQKSPSWVEEVKMKLPNRLSEKHHLLFTFYSVNTSYKKTGGSSLVSKFGYAIYPLYKNFQFTKHNRIDHSSVPVIIVDELPPKYLSLPDNHWQDKYAANGSEIFQFKYVLDSSILTEDPFLCQFYRYYHLKEFFADEKLQESIEKLLDFNPKDVITALPIFFQSLVRVICIRGQDIGVLAFNTFMRSIFKLQTMLGVIQRARTGIFHHYITYAFDIERDCEREPVEVIVNNWLFLSKYISMGKEKEISIENFFHTSWLFFDTIIKSIAISRDDNENLERIHLNREEFSKEGHSSRLIAKLMSVFANLAINSTKQNEKKMLEAIRMFNAHVSLFIRDLFSLWNRGFVMDAMYEYLEELDKLFSVNPNMVSLMKIDFLRIISDHEHWIPLNLPLEGFKFDNLDTYQKVKFEYPLMFLFIRHIVGSIMKILGEERQVKPQKNVKENIKENDKNEIKENKENEIKEKITEKDNQSQEDNKMAYICATLQQLIAKHEYDSRYQEKSKKERIAQVYFVLVEELIENWSTIKPFLEKKSDKISRKCLISSVLWVLENINKEVLKSWWGNAVVSRVVIFFELLAICGKTLSFDGSEDLLKIPPLMSAKFLPPYFALGISWTSKEKNHKLLNEKLGAQSALLVLDVLEEGFDFWKQQFSSVSNKPSQIFDKIAHCFWVLLDCRQSNRTLHCLFDSLHKFLKRYQNYIFVQNTPYCQELCRVVLRLCNYEIKEIRDEATLLFYEIITENNRIAFNLSRVKTQSSIALSTLVANNEISNEGFYLKKSLESLINLSIEDYQKTSIGIMPNSYQQKGRKDNNYYKSLFSREVQEISFTLTKLLQDSIKINEIMRTGDLEEIAELYFRIAASYSQTPDLRITWLKALSAFHEKADYHSEAAVCTLHIASLITDFLVNEAKVSTFKFDLSLFDKIMPGAVEYAQDNEEGTSQSYLFTQENLIETLIHAAKQFTNAKMYEYGDLIYSALLDLHEEQKDLLKISRCHKELCNLFDLLAKEDEQRFFPEYFRLGFYGVQFGELNGKQFVYREPPFTHLFEYKSKLIEFYSKKFGCDVEVWPNAGAIDLNQLSPEIAYIQLTKVKVLEKENVGTHFEKNVALSHFYFEMPFTQSGNAQSENVNEQYIKKTILSVPHPFPYMLKRQPISSFEHKIITPIEIAIGSIKAKSEELGSVVNKSPCEKNVLQALLQGILRPTVNAGPIKLAEVFLSSDSKNKWPNQFRELKDCFDYFLVICERGLEKNKAFASDSNAFQESLQVGYDNLLDLLSIVDISSNDLSDLNSSNSSPLLNMSRLKKFTNINRKSEIDDDSTN